jgi:hypothetical protein
MFSHLLHPVRYGLRLVAVAAVALGLSAGPATAQEYTVSLGLTGGLPLNDFGDQLDRTGLGFTGSVLYGLGPVAVGVEGGWMDYHRHAYPLPAQIDGRSAFLGQVETTSGIGHLHGVLRLQLPEGPVRPYIDGIAGVQTFATHTRFDQHVVLVSDPTYVVAPLPYPHWHWAHRYWHPVSTLWIHEPVAVDRRLTTTTLEDSDYALSYGVGGGLQFLLARGYDEGTPFRAYLDVGARYLLGQEARYRWSAWQTEDGFPIVHARRTRTDLFRPQVSLTVTFGS